MLLRIATSLLIFGSFLIAQAQDVKVHHVKFPSIGKINAYLVETKNNIVAIDAGFTTDAADRMLKKIDSIGKPLKAILLTHGHVDHYGGAALLARGSTPIITTSGVAEQIKKYDSAYSARFGQQLKERYPTMRGYPTQIVKNEYSIDVDGIKFKAIDLGGGEALTDVYWEVKAGDAIHAFVGDEVLNDIHGFFQDGHSKDWIENLEYLKKIVPANSVVYPGHGRLGSRDLFDWQIGYIKKYRDEVRNLASGSDKLSDDQKKILVTKMLEYLPDNTTTFLITWSADLMAKELKRDSN